MNPTCRSMETVSVTDQSSTIFPFSNRLIVMPGDDLRIGPK